MEFSRLNEVLHRFDGPLPGARAQMRMVNYARPIVHPEAAINAQTRMSGVMVVLFEAASEVHTLLIKRPDYEGVHGGQISFPGGKQEPEDPDLKFTALRETREEVGLPKEQINVIGAMTPVFIPPSNFFVRPFVGLLSEKPLFAPDSREVAALISLPVAHLASPESIVERKVFVSNLNARITVKSFDFEGHVIWGATAMMLAELAEILFGEA